MHCSMLFEIVQQPECNVLGHVPQEEMRELRKLVISAILHTDMAHHASVIKALRSLYYQYYEVFDVPSTEGGPAQERADILTANRALLAACMLHSCDVSNPAKPW